jgi:glycosyltransferase involved in cell wall biosynthesis
MFSIVIPLYNKGHTIRKTLESVFSQTVHDYEIIVVDDGSTDAGVSVIKAFTNDLRLKIISQENQGVSVARNNGVIHAKYEYVAFLDGDDEWLPHYLEKIREAIGIFPDAGMFCCAGFVKDSFVEYLRMAHKYEGKIVCVNYFENPHVFTHISATVVNRSVFNKSDGFPAGMKKNEDFALLYSMALLGKVVYCGFPLSIYWGGVEGQATKTKTDQGYAYSDVTKRLRICNIVWQKTMKREKLFLVFERYEIRHMVLGFIRKNEYADLQIFMQELGDDVLFDFYAIEKSLWTCKRLRALALIQIYVSKIIWRLNGFPRVK